MILVTLHWNRERERGFMHSRINLWNSLPHEAMKANAVADGDLAMIIYTSLHHLLSGLRHCRLFGQETLSLWNTAAGAECSSVPSLQNRLLTVLRPSSPVSALLTLEQRGKFKAPNLMFKVLNGLILGHLKDHLILRTRNHPQLFHASRKMELSFPRVKLFSDWVLVGIGLSLGNSFHQQLRTTGKLTMC